MKRLLRNASLVLALSGATAAEAQSSCPTSGPIIRRVESSSPYARGDETHSKIDSVKKDEYERDVLGARRFQNLISTLSDKATSDENSKACWTRILERWAEGAAFTERPTSSQGKIFQGWVLSTIGLSTIKLYLYDTTLNGVGTVSDWLNREKITTWINAIGYQVLQNDSSREKNTNLRYWNALSILAAGIVSGDQKLVSASHRLYQEGLKEIRLDGTLAPELKRGSRAIHYHFFAAQPLYVYELIHSTLVDKARGPFRPSDKLSLLLANIASFKTSPSFGRLQSQDQPREIGWLGPYCHEKKCEFSVPVETIPRLGGEIELLWRGIMNYRGVGHL